MPFKGNRYNITLTRNVAAVIVNVTWRNDNPNTIANVLARKLGRAPTNAELAADVRRIMNDGLIELAEQGK